MKSNVVVILLVALVTSGCVAGWVFESRRQIEDIAKLRTMLKASDPEDRAFAAYSLGRMPLDKESVQALTDTLGDPSAEVRWAAADGLALLGNAAKPALASLRTRASSDESEAVRQAATEAIKRID